MMDNKQLGILNSLVTYAAENVPGGLSSEETDVARLVGEWARGLTRPEEEQVFDHQLVFAGTGNVIEVVANQWAKRGWQVVGVVPPTKRGDGNLLLFAKPKNDVRTQQIRLEVDLEKIFHEAAGTLACDAGELLKMIQEIEHEHTS